MVCSVGLELTKVDCLNVPTVWSIIQSDSEKHMKHSLLIGCAQGHEVGVVVVLITSSDCHLHNKCPGSLLTARKLYLQMREKCNNKKKVENAFENYLKKFLDD